MKKLTLDVKHGLTNHRGSLDEWQQDSSKYTVTVKYDRKQMTIPFFMGSALNHEPTADDVMPCLLMDYSLVNNTNGFEDFCDELGYDSDSRKAEKSYKDTQKIAKSVERVFGEDIEELQRKFL
jgi:hypothetical protein